MKIVHLYLEYPNAALDQTFDYLAGAFPVRRGIRVKVPLRDRQAVGFVDSVEEIQDQKAYEKKKGFRLKEISGIIDEEPLLSEELWELGKWMAADTVTPLIACYRTMLPKVLKPQSRHTRARREAWLVYRKEPERMTEKQAQILRLVHQRDRLRADMNKISSSAVKTLLKGGALEMEEREKSACPPAAQAEDALPLTDEQAQVKREIEEGKKGEVFLLRGVTGSGKTEVYLQLARQVLEQGRQVLILVPEISLTPQMMERVTRRFSANAAIYHSGLSEQEKYEQYRLVQQRRVNVVVGTRSAVFMPFEDLGLIVLDEEHDSSYKQDSSPRYHCRDVALWRAERHGAKVVLGSATPSLESYARARRGVYHLVELPHRIHGSLAKTRIVDMTVESRRGNVLISEPLKRLIQERLDRSEQVILLLNRRGYAPVFRCAECGEVAHCPHCDLPMCYHREDDTLRCHVCGTTVSARIACANCGAVQWRRYGYGTERLEEAVRKMFPAARIVRLDADTARHKGAHSRILGAFAQGEYDILVGTQMIAKGLDYPRVTLVGVLNADALLERMDYRAVEMTFDLLVQASGRSGRSGKGGEVVLQVYNPRHYGIRCAARQDYIAFFNEEMRYRKVGKYPPYRYFISFVYEDPDQDRAYGASMALRKFLCEQGEDDLLGPSDIFRRKDCYRYRLLLRGKDLARMKEEAREWYELQRKEKSRVRLIINVNPVGLDE